MREDIYLSVCDILEENFELTVDVRNIGIEENLMDYGLDSIGMIKIVLAIEEYCKISIPDEDLLIDNFLSINRIVKYIGERNENR